ncbi:MAG: hypothetical protein FWF50_00870, partial [Defluviitaleaceae bacterium]|nr:hypothetical protein [Defluviitaleaceae bacterium]
MGFFSGKSFVPIEGRKDLSNTKPIKEFLNPNTVAIPLRTMDSEAFEALVSVGDKVKIGTKIGQRIDHFSVPLFSSISGTVIAIEKRDHASLKKADHIVIENDFKEEVEPLFEGGNLDSLSPEDVKARIKDLGVIGLGGAGFPTYIKFGNTADVKTLLINGVECEPYI